MLVDLHCHSTFSDGTESVAELVDRARRRDLALFALTDHDNCAGSDLVAQLLPAERVVRGVELTCREEDHPVHLLLYDVARDDRWQEVSVELEAAQRARRHRFRSIAARLEQLGLAIDVEPLLAAAGDRSLGRPDLARALVAAGKVGSTRQAFDRYLHDGGPADVPLARLSVADGLALADRAGARVALAHPHSIPHAWKLLRRYRDQGLEGIEAYYGLYSRREQNDWVKLAAAEGLVVTGGSDYHGTLFPQVGDVGVDLPEPHASRLQRWLRGG